MDVNANRRSRDRYRSVGGWLGSAWDLGQQLRGVGRQTGQLYLVGTDSFDPWHLAAHLDEQAIRGRCPGPRPTLLRRQPPATGAPHLRHGTDELADSGRCSTVLLVAPDQLHEEVLQQLADARRRGSTLLAVTGAESELETVAHAIAAIPESSQRSPGELFDLATHVVTISAGNEPPIPRRRKLARN